MAYNGINLQYDKIEDVAGLLLAAHEQIVPMLVNLHNRVNLLVDDGMVFQQSSEVIRTTYNNFDTSLTAAVKGINDFSEMFNGIMKNAIDFDEGIKNSLNQG
ncbi:MULTISPECIES: hypothetical protein [unclassified Streptomyces]|uniref:hypothetical protein n=1 Tax=unclassified Streptomyces TaxID=2593676 RepID=UPI0029B719A6|nr:MULTISPECIES: hypothetical protein [unclassified Streptomyces]MDX3850173.1 hypothetical protein [Streptomyces sp. AK02-01A]WSJ42257.1 hypothetical protein OG349_04280 [Streptomyces sp. NBC_01317]